MAERIQWAVNVQVAGGPRMSASQTVDVEAYDKLTVVVKEKVGTAAGTAKVDVQPGGTGQVRLLLVTADSYATPLTYKVDSGTEVLTLDEPLFLLGGGLGLVAATQKQFEFSNNGAAPRTVEILVGRDATP